MKRVTSMVMLTVLVATATITTRDSVEAAQTVVSPDAWISWQSAGDSYSAGEGLPGRVTEGDYGVCARSEDYAYGPQAVELLKLEWNINNVTFTACSGAVSEQMFNSSIHKGKLIDSEWEQSKDQGGGDTVDILVMSFGGNDIGFADVISDCVILPGTSGIDGFKAIVGLRVGAIVGGLVSDVNGCDITEDELERRLDGLFAPTSRCGHGGNGQYWLNRLDDNPDYMCMLNLGVDTAGGAEDAILWGSISDLYKKIVKNHLTERTGRLYVVGYPQLFAPHDEWPLIYKTNCAGIWPVHAEMLGRIARQFRDKMVDAVDGANTELRAELGSDDRIHFLDLYSLYRDNKAELCGANQTHLYGLLHPPMTLCCSFHPNVAGHAATADALAALVARTAITGHARIAFVSDRDGDRQIFTMDPDGSYQQRLIESSGDAYSPDWSPDGKAIVFSSSRGSSSTIRITDANGLFEHRVSAADADDDFRYTAPRWSPQGAQGGRIAFVGIDVDGSDVDTEIWVMDESGGGLARLSGGSGSKYNPSWSPKGEFVAYDTVSGEIRVKTGQRPEDETVTLIARDGVVTNMCVDWSPDGSEMVFVSDRDGDEEIFIMNSDGSDQRQITENGAIVGCPDWSPDGLEIMFASDRDGDSEIYTMSVDGSGVRQLTDNSYDDFQARYSPLVESSGRHRSTESPEGDYGSIASGWDHACALDAAQTITCWGNNVDGQAEAPSGSFSAVSAGDGHSCALGVDGTVECWGNNFFGQTDAPEGSHTAVSAGWDHSCALSAAGAITCWGTNQYGQSDAPAGTYSAISVGNSYSCALGMDATITCWGNNGDGQASAPAGTYRAIAAGTAHACALGADDTIACWGGNWLGQTDAPAGTYSAVAAGDRHSCAVRQDGTLTCWGDNGSYQSSTPDDTYTAVTAGSTHSCALATGNTIICWGELETPEA